MTARVDSCQTLSEKEKQTLRLIVRGHDAKSTARSLGLSVHTINERLRDARRKLAVSTSREAARLLLEAEGGLPAAIPETVGYARIGEDASAPPMDQEVAPDHGAGRPDRRSWIIGVSLMTFALALLALAGLTQPATTVPQEVPSSVEAPNPEVVDSARRWLVLLDGGRWDESYRETASSFRQINTAQIWATISGKVRAPLGVPLSRTLISQENLPAPPHGYEVVKFRTRFAGGRDVVETVSLDREDGRWRVVGVTIG